MATVLTLSLIVLCILLILQVLEIMRSPGNGFVEQFAYYAGKNSRQFEVTLYITWQHYQPKQQQAESEVTQ